MRRDQKLNVEITASDKASAQITDVADKVDKLDGKEASVTVDADTKGFTEGVDGLDGRLDDVLGKVKDIGGRGAAGGVLAIGAGLLAAADHAADVAIEVGNLKALTGDTAEDASKLNGVWKQGGFDANDLQDVLLQMNGVLSTSPELAERLGINLADGKSTGDRFLEVTKKLGSEFTDAGERSQIASQLFGEEGVRQVNAVEQAFGDLSTAVDDYSGKVWSDEEIARMREYKAEVARVTTEFEQLAVKGGSSFLRLKGGIEDAGYSIGLFFRALATGEDTFDNWGDTKAFEAAVEQARLFDKSLLDAATTIEEARKIAEDYGLELHAVNLVTNEWAANNKEAAAAAEESAAQTKIGGDHAEYAAGRIAALAQADDEAARAADEAAAAARRQNQALATQAERVDELNGKKIQLVGGDIAVRNAQREAASAAGELEGALSGLTVGTDEYQAAVDAAVEKQLASAEASASYRVEQLEANGVTLSAKQEANVYKQELEKLASQLTGPMREAILGYITDLDAIPSSKTTVITATGARIGITASGAKKGSRATGGPTSPGIWEVNEHGPEVYEEDGKTYLMTSRHGAVTPSAQVGPALQPQFQPEMLSDRRPLTISMKGANFYGAPSPQWIAQMMRQAERYARGLR